jgi:predicted acetyltransferase
VVGDKVAIARRGHPARHKTRKPRTWQGHGVANSEGVRLKRADVATRLVVERLAQVERHDLSHLTGELPGPSGLYDVELERFFEEPDHEAHLIYTDDRPVGFGLVRPYEDRAFVHAFFVVKAVRRRGVGRAAARELLKTKERWAIAFREDNGPAEGFWRRVVGVSEREERRKGFTFLYVDR